MLDICMEVFKIVFGTSQACEELRQDLGPSFRGLFPVTALRDSVMPFSDRSAACFSFPWGGHGSKPSLHPQAS